MCTMAFNKVHVYEHMEQHITKIPAKWNKMKNIETHAESLPKKL